MTRLYLYKWTDPNPPSGVYDCYCFDERWFLTELTPTMIREQVQLIKNTGVNPDICDVMRSLNICEMYLEDEEEFLLLVDVEYVDLAELI